MLRNWVLSSISVMAAAAFLMGTPDSAWARRCGCRNTGSYSGGTWGGGLRNGFVGGGWNNGYSGTTAACCGNNMSTSTNMTYTPQQYSTGYAPVYDGNGNLISNGAPTNATAPAPVNPNAPAPVNATAPTPAAPAPAPAPAAPVPVQDK